VKFSQKVEKKWIFISQDSFQIALKGIFYLIYSSVDIKKILQDSHGKYSPGQLG
jgi:hypothetical protein